jgi:hypothetical protein
VWLVGVQGVSSFGPGFAHAVGVAAGDDDGVVQEAVQEADGGGVLGQEPAPLNWNWLRFVIVVLAFDLLLSTSGVSA